MRQHFGSDPRLCEMTLVMGMAVLSPEIGCFSSETSDDAEKFLAEPEQAERCRTCSQELVTHARKEEYTQTNHHRMRHNNRIN